MEPAENKKRIKQYPSRFLEKIAEVRRRQREFVFGIGSEDELEDLMREVEEECKEKKIRREYLKDSARDFGIAAVAGLTTIATYFWGNACYNDIDYNFSQDLARSISDYAGMGFFYATSFCSAIASGCYGMKSLFSLRKTFRIKEAIEEYNKDNEENFW